MSRTHALFAAIALFAACSHQSLPGEGTGGTAGGGATGGSGGAPATGGSPGTAGAGGTAGAAGSGGTVGDCTTPSPADGCRSATNACIPSSCKCSAGGWLCTKDCTGGRNCADAGMASCPPTCFRAIRCVTTCGGPAVSHGCCSCVPPAFDDISCPRTAAFESFLYTKGGGLCPPGADCSSTTELLASGLLRHDCMGQVPVVVHEATVPAADRDTAIAVLTDPALVKLLDQPGPPCQPPTDISEVMVLSAGGQPHKNSVTLCTQQPIESARSVLDKLVFRYLAGKCPKP
jgi:hypothetical protein